MQSTVRVLLVLVALSQVECAPPSIWPAHRFSPPELWPFKQQPAAAPTPLSFFTHFPEPSHSIVDMALPVEAIVEPIIDAGNPVPIEVLPEESTLPSEIIIQEIVEVESVPQPQEPVVFGNKIITPILEVAVENVTNVPVETSTATVTTAVPVSFRDTKTYQAYEQFLSTWLQQASITMNRPDLFNMFTPTKQNIFNPEVSPVKQSVSKSVEKVVEQVTVSESMEPQVTPVQVATPEISEPLKKISGPLKKTPVNLLSKSTTDIPLMTDSAVSDVKLVLTPVPVSSSDIAVPSEPLDATVIAPNPVLESQHLEVIATPEQIAFDLVPESSPIQEQTIFDFDFAAEPSFLQPEPVPSPEVAVPSEPLEITIIATDPALESQNIEIVATPEEIPFELIPESPLVQDQTISEIDLVAEPSFLQPVVVSHPAVEEFRVSVDPQLTESSYSQLSVSPSGTVIVAQNPQAITSSAQPSLVLTAPRPFQPAVRESFSPQGLTYTLKYFPRQRSSFFYSHALGG